MSINELFATNTTTTTGRAGLPGTAELTAIASDVAREVITAMEANIDEYREKIAESSKDNSVLDALIESIKPLAEVDVSFLQELDTTVVDNILKSQQSKRSRARSKAMTLDNYKSLMTAAIAENLIRLATGKTKTSGGRMNSTSELTPARLEELAADQEALRREIRNVQSKKSIMKSKADFDEASEGWQYLLKAEAMLKDLRVGGRTQHVVEVEVDHTKNALQEMMSDIDPEHMKAADSKDLLAKIAEMLKQ